MHCLAGLDDATGGTVTIGDTDLTTLNDKDMTRLRRDRIGFVFQSYNLVPTLTARENIVYYGRLHGMSEVAAQQRSELLARMLERDQ